MRSGSVKEEEIAPVLETDDDDGTEWEGEQFDKDGEPVPHKKGHGDDEEETEDYSMFDDWREREEYA